MLIQALAALAVMSGPGQEAAPRGDGPERIAPRGDYRASCSGEYVNRGRLYADCRDRRGNIRGTSIELNRCSDHEIRNENGLLTCGSWRGDYEDGAGGGRPGGDRPGRGDGHDRGGGWGGRNAVMVFRDSNFRGASLRFDEAIPNLANSGFNDAISSIQFRGEWEVCTDSYYRGHCRTFRDDVRNLQQWGMNDRISSLRPVGRGRR